ncbi:Uncharacterized protein TCM_038053 [Theobroma cacao]|uniref:Uncharacterized protein n=1 Tax=Theobroma cacao TaxID=3641 RepID=A0A061GNN8_THECC|nr:Uncharacterized protein TCM_038053 [Theobroma cacao]
MGRGNVGGGQKRWNAKGLATCVGKEISLEVVTCRDGIGCYYSQLLGLEYGPICSSALSCGEWMKKADHGFRSSLHFRRLSSLLFLT